jgi:pyrroline-5-carboxylate reductase
MGQVLARSAIRAQIFQPHEICVLDHNPHKLQQLAAETGIQTCFELHKIATAEILLLAVKPDNVSEILLGLQTCPVPAEQVLVSIVAGIPLTRLASFRPDASAIVRVMTNTPCLVGAGMSVLAPNPHVTQLQMEQIRQLFEAVGKTLVTPEKYLDAVTGLSGSGPGFFFLIVDALIEAGVLQGLPRETARQLVLQTMKGSAQLMEESNRHPAQLRDMVTSPGGTTIAGIQVMEEYKIRATLLKTVETATRRSRELGQKQGE